MKQYTNKQVLDAIKGSERKWICIIDGGEQGGASDCPLCGLFWDNYCKGCPIREYSGFKDCNNTPFDDFCQVDWYGTSSQRRRAAQKMLTFIRKVRRHFFGDAK